MTTTEIILALVAVAAGSALVAVLVWHARGSAALGTLEERLRSRDGELVGLRETLELAEAERQTLRDENSSLKQERAQLGSRLDAEREAAAEKLDLLNKAEERLKEAFQALSSEALKSSNESFLTLARTQLEKFQESSRTDLDARKLAVENMVKPISETLQKVDVKLQEVEKGRVAAEATLLEQLKSVHLTQQSLQMETSKLVTALRAPNVRGRWGEIQLKRVVEISGMIEHCDFHQQATQENTAGRFRPDLVVRLPGGRSVVVDSKVPLTHYLEALEASDETARAASLTAHAAQVRRHLNELGGKAYWDSLDGTPEFVVLFLPGETFFSAALEKDPSLIEHGVDNGVIIASPTTLIALLKAVSYGWRQEKIAENAREISELGRTLYDRVRVMAEHLVKVGKGLDRAIESYNAGIGSLERNVLPAARRFRDLRAATGEDIPTLDPVDKSSRTIMAPELTAIDDVTDRIEIGAGGAAEPANLDEDIPRPALP